MRHSAKSIGCWLAFMLLWAAGWALRASFGQAGVSDPWAFSLPAVDGNDVPLLMAAVPPETSATNAPDTIVTNLPARMDTNAPAAAVTNLSAMPDANVPAMPIANVPEEGFPSLLEAVSTNPSGEATILLTGAGDDEPADDATTPHDSLVVTPAQAKMYSGMTDMQDKNYTSAIPKLEWAIAEDPALLGAWESLGWAYWLTGRMNDAKVLWERLVLIAPNEPIGYNLLASVATREGKLDRAEELYRHSMSLKGDQYETRYNYARVLLWNGKREKAVAELRDLFRIDPDRTDVEIDLAWAMYANEEYEDSLAIWDHICEMTNFKPDYLLARARTFVLIGSLPEAEADARRVLEADKNNRGALNLLADIAMRSRQPQDVVDTLEKVMDLAEGDEEKARIARRIAGYKRSAYDKDHSVFTMKECVEAARRAFDLYPDDINGRLFYAEILVADKQYTRAAGEFQEVLDKINPMNERARTGLLETFFGRAMYDEAEEQLNDNLRTFDANDPFQYVYWARLHFARGNFTEALEALDRLEQAGAQGAVFTLAYHGLSPSEWTDMPSVRQFQDHLMSLKRAGFRFITPNEFEAYFKKQKAPELVDTRPTLNRAVQSVRYAWTGQRTDAQPVLRDYTPDRMVCVTFDDGLRASFRYATPMAEELQIRMTMFVPVGLVLAKDMYVASFSEVREYLRGGRWEIGSHLMDASTPAPIDRNGSLQYPLPNLLWLPDRNRQESLREYYQRLRREFRESRELLLRELKMEPEELQSVSYPMGEIGQNTTCNIRLFDVPEVVLNEAAISYRMGFLQYRYGYSMKTANSLMLNRFEPPRNASGHEVVREAFLQHPVFVARRMRVEMAVLQGQLYLAQETLKTLKRDGYPEEDLTELNDYVQRHLARLAQAPESVNDDTERKKERALELRHPYIGVEGSWTKANVMIDEWHAAIKGGLNLNRRLILEARAGIGAIRQEVKSNNWTEVDTMIVSTSRTQVVTVENDQTTTSDETTISSSSKTISSNTVTTRKYKSDETMVGLALNFVHPSGSLSIMDLRLRSFTGDLTNQSVIAFALEHQWRPTLAVDVAARYQHNMVPSARVITEYDGVAALTIWRIFDWWHANGNASYSIYSDDNSFLHAAVESFWRLSQKQDFWLGWHSAVDTTDKASDLYWTPYWDQRHYFILRLRRSYPNYFGMVRVNMGWQKGKGRPQEMDDYNNRKVRAAAQGWYPGEDPDQDWDTMIGIGASLTRKWASGFELGVEFGVNSMRDYTEHLLSGSLLYRF